jgi:hypothetical protein
MSAPPVHAEPEYLTIWQDVYPDSQTNDNAATGNEYSRRKSAYDWNGDPAALWYDRATCMANIRIRESEYY